MTRGAPGTPAFHFTRALAFGLEYYLLNRRAVRRLVGLALGTAADQAAYHATSEEARDALLRSIAAVRTLLAQLSHPGPRPRGELVIRTAEDLAGLALDARIPLEALPPLLAALEELPEEAGAGVTLRVVQGPRGLRVTRLRALSSER
jgi:hypothetical protein